MLISGQQHLHNLPMKQFSIYHNNYTSFCLSIIILICKLIVLIGLFITFFSDHWALSLHSPNIYAGYKNRCTVHQCPLNDTDPVWLIDIAYLLGIINFKIELINIILHYCYIDKASKLKMIIGKRKKKEFYKLIKFYSLEGCIVFSTFILTICLVIFFVYLSIYAYDLPMGYAYSCFIVSIYFSSIDGICSLKRFVSLY